MIKSPTVLVLGAGASAPYHFPTGETLLRNVVDGIRLGNSPNSSRLKECGSEWQEISDFGTALNASMLASVDLFLERRNGFMEVGKRAIAATLIPFETPGALGRGVDSPSDCRGTVLIIIR